MEKWEWFDMQKCVDYINSIEDFVIEYDADYIIIDKANDTVINFIEQDGIKYLLFKFISECEQQQERLSTFKFLEWLESRKHFWRSQQYTIISRLNEVVKQNDGIDSENVKIKKDKYLHFFKHNYWIIDIITKDIQENLNKTIPAVIQHNKESLNKAFQDYGFFELALIQKLSKESQQNLIDILITNDLPYKIAMIEYLGYVKFLMKNIFTTRVEMDKWLADIFKSTPRTVKGNINVLNEPSNEDRERYRSHLYRETVQKDYQMLK